MAVSNTYNFNMPVDEIIIKALKRLGDGHYDGETIEDAKQSLNLVLNELLNESVPLSFIKLKSIPVSSGVSEYSLGTSVNDVLDMVTETSGTELQIRRLSFTDFNRISNKTQTSYRPTQYTTERGFDNVTLKIWPVPTSTTNTRNLKFYAVMKPDDISNFTQNISLPARYLPCVIAGLAYHMSWERTGVDPAYRQELKANYEELKAEAKREDSERTSFFAVPNLRGW